MCNTGWGCAVQAKGVQCGLRVCSTGWGTPAVQAEGVQNRLRNAEQSVSLSPYCTPTTRTAHPQPVLHTLSPYCTPTARTAHPQPVLHTLSPYCTPSACTARPQPVLHTLSPYCAYFIQVEVFLTKTLLVIYSSCSKLASIWILLLSSKRII